MKNKSILTIAVAVMVGAILACNAPIGGSSGQPDYVATITAQAAMLGQSNSQAANTPAPGQPTTAAAAIVTATVTATTNCRMGPGTGYNIVTSLNVGQKVTVVGQDTADNYWIVDNPNANGTCWLWGQTSTLSGDPSGLPQLQPAAALGPSASSTPKPTKTPKPTAQATDTAKPSGPPPADPANVTVGHYYCKLVKTALGTYNYQAGFYINWDQTPDPTVQGFHVYRNGDFLTTVGPTATGYTDAVTIDGVSATNLPVIDNKYSVESFSVNGTSRLWSGHSQCP